MPAKRKTGRPTKFSDALAKRICIQIAEGKSVRKICKSASMPSLTTLFRWLDEKPGFRDQYARAREWQAELYADEIVDISDSCADAQKARVRIDARKWTAVKLLPKKYGDRVHNEHSGAIARFDPSKLEGLSDEELAVAEKLFGKLAGSTSDDAESDQGGEGEA